MKDFYVKLAFSIFPVLLNAGVIDSRSRIVIHHATRLLLQIRPRKVLVADKIGKSLGLMISVAIQSVDYQTRRIIRAVPAEGRDAD